MKNLKFEQSNQTEREDKVEYWQKFDQEFGLAVEILSRYFKKIGQDKEAEDIIHEWLQELINWRSENGISPIQNIENDIVDLKKILTDKLEGNLLSEDATADSCYYSRLLLLNFETSELHRNPKLRYKKEEDADHEDESGFNARMNDIQKERFYLDAKKYLFNKDVYSKNKRADGQSLNRDKLDPDALIVLNKIQVLDAFYKYQDWHISETFPSFVADEMIRRGQRYALYFSSNFSKFESFSNLVAKDIFNNGAAYVTNKFLNHFDRFSETDPLWALDKILKCSHVFGGNDLDSTIDFIDKYIKNPADIKKAYRLILNYGVKIDDVKISPKLTEEEKQEYQNIRNKFTSDISSIFGEKYLPLFHNKIGDLKKFHEMLEEGYAPILLRLIGGHDIDFDKKILVDSAKKNKQSTYLLRLAGNNIRDVVDINNLIDDAISEGDLDVLAAHLNLWKISNNISEKNIIKLWENGYAEVIKENVKNFSNLSDKVLQLFFDSNNESIVFPNIDKFNLNTESLKKVIDNYSDKLAKCDDINLKYFEKQGLFPYLLEKIKDPIFLENSIKYFNNLTLESKNKFIEAVRPTHVFNNLLLHVIENHTEENNLMTDLDFEISGAHLDDLVENNIGQQVASSFSAVKSIKNKPQDSFYIKNINIFIDKNNSALAYFFFVLRRDNILHRSQNDLDLCFAADSNLAYKLIDSKSIGLLINNLEKFKKLNQEVANVLFEAGANGINSLIDNIEKIEDLNRDFAYKILTSLQDFSKIVKINDYFNPPLDRLITKTSEIFGDFADNDTYNIIKSVNNNNKEIIKKLKLKKGGNDGLREIQEKFVEFKGKIILEDFNPEILISENSNSLYLPYFQSYIRFNTSQWGLKSDEAFNNMIKNYIDYKNEGEIKELNNNFKPSPELLIAKSNIEDRDNHKFNEHFINRFSVLVESIKSAKSLYQEKFPLSKLVKNIEEKRQELIKDLAEKFDNMPNPAAREGINKKINSLKSINVRSVKDFQNNFSILAKNNKFNELLRQTVFLISFAKNKESLNFNLDDINLDKPKLDDISWVLNFVDHITNQETMSEYFVDKKSKRLFEEIISTKAINEEMALLQNTGKQSKDFSKIQLIPTRGILTEFSGHIADACWASRYNSILKTFPNFTSVIIRQNPETKHERLAGAFLLIETQSKDDDPLLVIRGFNPIENLINSLSVEDFYNQVVGYVKDLAEKDDRKVAIVIDDHSGGAATNRPVLFKYLESLTKELEAVDLKSNDDTSFNGYNIVRKTYLVK